MSKKIFNNLEQNFRTLNEISIVVEKYLRNHPGVLIGEIYTLSLNMCLSEGCGYSSNSFSLIKREHYEMD